MCMFVRVFWGRKYTITYFMIIALYKKSKGKHNFKIYRLPLDSFSISKPRLLAAQAGSFQPGIPGLASNGRCQP